MPSLYFWHGWQVKRAAQSLLVRAESLKQDDDLMESVGYLRKYLQLVPGDDQVKIQLAQEFDEASTTNAHKNRSVDFYFSALAAAKDEEKEKLRSRLIELLIELQRYSEAETESRKVIEEDKENAAANRQLALALYGQFVSGALEGKGVEAYETVGQSLDNAHRLNPDDVKVSSLLAFLLRENIKLLSKEKRQLSQPDREKLADEIIQNMLAANQENFKALLASYRYHKRYQNGPADAELQKALELAPDDLEVRVTAALAASQKILSESATEDEKKQAINTTIGHYQHILDNIDPTNQGAYLGIAEGHLLLKETDLAIQVLNQGNEKTKNNSILLLKRLAEIQLDGRKFNSAKKTLASLDTAIEARSIYVSKNNRASLQLIQDLLNARLDLALGSTLSAIPKLQRVISVSITQPGRGFEQFQALYLLGGSYSLLGHWDQAANAYEEAAVLRPKNVPTRLAAAASWNNAGMPGQAIKHYEKAVAETPTADIWLSLATACLRKEITLLPADQNWTQFNLALKNAEKLLETTPLENPWRLNLLAVNYQTIIGSQSSDGDPASKEVITTLKEIENQYQDDINLLAQLVASYEKLDQPKDADRVLKLLLKKAPGNAGVHLAQARLYTQRKDYKKARATLEQAVASLPSITHTEFQKELMQLDLFEDNKAEASQKLAQIHSQNPSDLPTVRALVDLSLKNKNFEQTGKWLSKLEELEGKNGASWLYYQAKYLLAQCEDPKVSKEARDANLDKASKIQSTLQRSRPDWAAARLLGGHIEEYRRNYDESITAYQNAIRLGEHSVSVYERLIQLLYAKRRFTEAEKYLSLLHSHNQFTPTTQNIEISLAVQQGKPDQALELAQKRAAENPKDFMAHFWLGQMQILNNQNEEAEASLKKAVSLEPKDVRSWNALFAFYVKTGRDESALQALQSLSDNVELSKQDNAFVFAQGYELLNDPKKALEQYRLAEAEDPSNVTVAMRLAAFLLKTDVVAAEKALRRVLKLDPKSDEARRTLAAVLAQQGGEEQWAEAQQLLIETGASQDIAVLDQRLQAVLLVKRGGRENLAKARDLIATLVKNSSTPVDGDRLLLAKLNESQSGFKSDSDEKELLEKQQLLQVAEQQYLVLVSRTNANAQHISSFVKFLLRQNRNEDATRWTHQFDDRIANSQSLNSSELAIGIELLLLTDLFSEAELRLNQLEKITPFSLQFTTLKANLLAKQNRIPEIGPLVDTYVGKALESIDEENVEANLYLSMGKLCSTLKAHESAEKWSRQLVKLLPQNYELLAISLTKLDRYSEAIQLCVDSAEKDKSTRPIIVLSTVLSDASPSAEEFKQIEPLVKEALELHPENTIVQLSAASIRIVQNQDAEAIKLLRGVLKENPNNVIALNNLAALLGEQPSAREEALQLINKAIELSGKHPALYDTKGTLLVYTGDAEEAEKFLITAAAESDDPRYRFHLALAYQGAGKVEDAKRELEGALSANLEDYQLTKTDQQYLEDIKQFVKQ